MKSFIAALRSLVLPFGATSGRRILLDGVGGVISVFDAASIKRLEVGGAEGNIRVFDDSGDVRFNIGENANLTVFDAAGDRRLEIDSAGGLLEIFNDSGVEIASISASNGFRSEDATGDAFAQLHSQPSSAFLMMGPPNPVDDTFVFAIIDTDFDDHGGSVYTPKMTILGPNDVGKDFGALFLTGERTDGSVRPHLMVGGFNEMNLILPDGDFVHNGVSAPRGTGVGGYASAAGPTALSTTAGTWTTLVDLNDYAVKAGRRYLVLGDSGHSWVTGGSGFTGNDFWEQEVQVNAGAGFVSITPVRAYKRVRSNNWVAAARWPGMITYGVYEPGADATVDFRLRGVKGGGAATVTTTADTNGGATPHFILVQDVGSA